MPRLAAILLALAVVLGGGGCDRRVLPYVPSAEEPPPFEGALRVPGLENPAAQARVTAPPIGSGRIRGTIRLGEGVPANGRGVLFVIARAGAGGPPLAVRRLSPGPFPMEFELGPEDSMMAQQPLQGPVTLSARLDADGNAMTRQPGDLVAELAEPIVPGASGVTLVLVVAED